MIPLKNVLQNIISSTQHSLSCTSQTNVHVFLRQTCTATHVSALEYPRYSLARMLAGFGAPPEQAVFWSDKGIRDKDNTAWTQQ